MTILKADILTFVNEAVEAQYSGTDLDVKIQTALDDLAEMHCLKAEDATQTLTDASSYLVYPTNCLSTEQAIISVVLRDIDDVRGKPLRQIPGGWFEYNRIMENASYSSRGDPEYMVCHDRKIYLYPAPDENFTTSIWYYKKHQALSSGIEFPDECKNLICFGAVYFVYLLGGDRNGMEIWGPLYRDEKEAFRTRIPRGTGIIGG